MNISIKNIITPSIPLAISSIILCFSLWTYCYFNDLFHGITTQSSVHSFFKVGIFNNLLVSNLISIAFTLSNAFLLIQLNNKFTIIRTRTFLPILIFILLSCTWSTTHLTDESDICLTLFLLSLFYIFNMYRNPTGVEQSFMGSLIIGISSLIVNHMLFFIPIFWIGYGIFQSISVRTFLSSVFGAITPWIFYISTLKINQPDYNLNNLLVLNKNLFFDINSITFINKFYIALLALVFIFCSLGMFVNSRADATHTRSKLNLLLLLFLTNCVLSLLFVNVTSAFIPIIGILYAIIVSHSFTLIQSKFYSYLFVAFCCINVLYIFTKNIH